MTFAVATPALPSWVMGIVVTFVLIPLMGFAVRQRQRAAQRELARFARVAQLPDPGVDTAPVLDRLASRYAGRIIGVTAVVVLSLAGASITEATDRFPVWIPIALPVGMAVGTAVGNLLSTSLRGPTLRVATLRRRELTDYVTPAEVRVAQLGWVVPIAAIVMGVLTLTSTTSTTTSGVIVTVAGVLSFLAAVGTWTLAGRVLVQSTDVTTPAGLLWSEVLRASLLRDLLSAVAMFGLWGGGGALLWGIANGWSNYPDWYLIVGAMVLVVVLGGTALGLIAATKDRRFDRVRREALAEVAP